jgi:hypothetical protein
MKRCRDGVLPIAKTRVEGMSADRETELVTTGMVQVYMAVRVMDPGNTNAAGIASENMKRVVEAFSEVD